MMNISEVIMMNIKVVLLTIAIVALPSAWLTHIIVCLQDDRWGFLIAGALMFPIAIIHGVGTWFGVW